MTIKEFQISLEQKIKNIEVISKPLQIAAFDTTTKMAERIFDKGKKTDGGDIGQYSTKPMYLNPDVLRTMNVPANIGVPRGKTGETKFKTGKKKGQSHKTKYLAGGYKELRSKLGRQTGFVDLKLSKELQFDFGTLPRKINELEYQIRLDQLINQEKRGGMEEKYGIIFTPSESEKENFFTVIGYEFRNALSNQK